jgi:trans-aconitate 2-methyltransferase
MFGQTFLKGIDEKTVDIILEEVQDKLQATNFRDNKWFADYKRLRITAIKQKDH